MAVNFEVLLINMIKPLVANPEEVVVNVLESDNTNIEIQVLVNEEDLGRVIGRGGKIASAIRTICYAGAAKENKRVQINIEAL